MPIWQLCISLLFFMEQNLMCDAFYPNQFSRYVSGDDFSHAEITEIGILKATDDFLRSRRKFVPSSHFSEDHKDESLGLNTRALFNKYFGEEVSDKRLVDAIQDISKHNNFVDKNYERVAAWHFNGEQIQNGHFKMQNLRARIIYELSLAYPNYGLVRELLGQFLHMLQMFYSNTNWIEVRGQEICSSLGIKGKMIIPTAPVHMDTCDSCSVSRNCLGNILLADFLTSGYKSNQDISKPYKSIYNYTTGKCSHGGPHDLLSSTSAAVGGINKDTGNPLYSPHFYLHSSAAQAAIEHTWRFFTDKKFGLSSIIEESKFMELLGLTHSQSLLFVVDSTSKIANRATESIKDIISVIEKSRQHDKSFQIIIGTDSASAFYSSENASSIIGLLGRHIKENVTMCKAITTKLILEALQRVRFHSVVYIFTDDEVNDRVDSELTQYSTEKKLIVNIIKNEECEDSNHRDIFTPDSSPFKYKEIAKRSSTRILSPARLVSLVQKTLNETENGAIQFPVDVSLRELNISIRTKRESSIPVIQLPSGKYMTVDKYLVHRKNGFYIHVQNPQVGMWHVYKTQTSDWVVNITGSSHLYATCTFVEKDMFDHAQYLLSQSSEGKSQDIIIQLTSQSLFTRLEELIVEDQKGQIMQESPLQIEFLNGQRVFKSSFTVPVENYNLFLIGKDKAKLPFRRGCSESTQGQNGHTRHKRALSTWNIPSAFTQISTITGGQVYKSQSGNSATAQSILQGALNFLDVMILRLNFPGGAGGYGSVNIPIDDTIKQFTVTIDGITGRPPYRLLDPTGNSINFLSSVGNTTSTILGSTIVRLVIKDPEVGMWSLMRLDDKAWNLEVKGQSTLEFTTKFLKTASNGYTQYEITGRPVIGESLTTVITVNDESRINTVDNLYMLDENGQEIAHYKLTAKTGGRVHGVYYTDITVPNKKFQFVVEGYDKTGAQYRRQEIAMITPVAVDLNIHPLPGPFYTNENLEVTYFVQNTGVGTSDISVKITDDQGFSISPTEKTHTLGAGKNITDKFIIHAFNTAGVVTTITVSAQPVSLTSGNFQYDTVRTVTEDRINKPTDTKDPVCSLLGSVKGSCTKICGCETEFVEADTESSDEGFGIYTVTANNVGNTSTFSNSNFVPGITKSQGTVKSHLKVDCCRQKAYVTVTDFASRSTQCVISVNSAWTASGCTTTMSTSTTSATTTTTTTAATSTTKQPTTATGNSATTTKTTTTESSEENSTWLTTPAKIGIGCGAGVLSVAAITTGVILIKKKYSAVSPD